VIRPATLEDIVHVGNTMWERGKEELGWLGVSPWLWFEGFKTRINRGDAVAFGNPGEPHAVLGWDWDMHPNICCTSFQASKSFELPGVGKQVTKALRREIPRLMEETRALECHVYSLCVDPGAPKWFRLLGFHESTQYKGPQRGPYHMRRFVRRA